MIDKEKASLEQFRKEVDIHIQNSANKSWDERRKVAHDLLSKANAVWWRIHTANPLAYEKDLQLLNEIAGWTNNEQRQVSVWRTDAAQQMLMPPKFFGGNPLVLEECFVALMSLNHKELGRGNKMFLSEMADIQFRDNAFDAYKAYFDKKYAYSKFFMPRGRILHEYAKLLQQRNLPVIAEVGWRELNTRFAFYIEALPTRSPKSGKCPDFETRRELNRRVFVCAINAIVHEIVAQLLRPSCVLLSGKATWDLWPDAGLADYGRDVGLEVRPNGKACPVFMNSANSTVHGEQTLIVRCNFLRTVYGPNSRAELRQLGRIMAIRKTKGLWQNV